MSGKRTTADICKPENLKGEPKTHLSPSGNFRLVVSTFHSGPNTWECTQGDVYLGDSPTPIASVQRNYSHFPFLFVENHPNGHPYLVCGEDYQGQTVIELDTGRVVNNMSFGAEKGVGFCWSSYTYEVKEQLLVVTGCYWASSYEVKLFDFSDPMNKGWPEIEVPDWIDDDTRPLSFNEDGTITAFVSSYVSSKKDNEDSDPEERWEAALDGIRVFRREGNKLILISTWESEYARKQRLQDEDDSRRYQEWLDTFKKSDLYLEFLRQKETFPTASDHSTVGWTHGAWCPKEVWEGPGQRRWCHRIVQKSEANGHTYSMELEWAADDGPVLLQVYKDQEEDRSYWFKEHSIVSIKAAFDKARSILRGEA